MTQTNINDFDLLNALGSGSYSTVFRACQKVIIFTWCLDFTHIFNIFFYFKKTKEYYAVKRVAIQNLSKSSTENLLREIKLLKTLKHKYIVEMIDFRWDDK